MTNILFTQQWFIIVLVFGAIFSLAWNRWRDRIWIKQRFGDQPVIAQSFGVNYFGKVTQPGTPRRQSGFLLLLPDRLFFRSRKANVDLEIAVPSIKRVYHGTSHKGVDLHRSVIKVDFLTDQGQKDTVAFAVPYPPQWIQVIKNTISGGQDLPAGPDSVSEK
jgi:hypothetical protein